MIVINATNKLLKEYYGVVPSNSLGSIMIMDGNKPVGASGFKYEDGKMIWYADFSDELRNNSSYKRALINGWRLLANILPDMPVYSLADPEIEGSVALLEHLGFQQVEGDVWIL